MRGRLFAFALGLLATMLASARADAWYFPEHVVLTGDGHAALAPELRAIITDAVADARREGLTLCEHTELRLEDVLRDVPLTTPTIRTPSSVACVPYAALPALAGDHANDLSDLRTVLTTPKGIELVSAVAFEWHRFQEAARRGQASLDRMSFVHDLDVALYFLDAGYVTRARATRAHFRDVGRTFETVLRELAVDGRIDDLLGRFVFHHVRSLLLAASGKRVDALLEHAFALHFLEDAFSAGHLVMSDASWTDGRDAVRWRHDAFDANGLLVTREMSREPCPTLATDTVELAGLPHCWTTSGDGHLSFTADASDRVHAAAALSRAETAFAMALDPARVIAFARGLGDLELTALGSKLNPVPWWTVDDATRHELRSGPKHAMHLVQNAANAALELRRLPTPPAADVSVIRRPGAVDAGVVAGVLATPVLGDDEHEPREAVPADVGVTLVRPTLAQLPASVMDTATLHPEGHLDHGWAVQLFAATGATVIVPGSAPVDFLAPSVGASVGFSYRWGSLLPGRRARAIAELNLGVSEMLHVDSRGQAGGRGQITLLDQELRWPVVWEALTTYNLPLDVAALHRAGRILFLNGMRTHEVLAGSSLAFQGIELEALAIALHDGYGAHPLYTVSPELRFYVGVANPSAAQPSFPSALGGTFGLVLTGGYATFL